MRLGGQVRAIPGAVLGFDMTAALTMARVLGIDELAVVELLPSVEAQMVRQSNSRGAE